ncbi:hypothetical protein ASC89_00260 [Devosia sp. Root413D1]|uniref:recombinase family protein n=1 Tax=Devosia sp. Root413D1 TaxID=1736531 RepID=UPI0006F7DB57|nr:recombinase family protein [Devosia sp. Root413D1]KQW85557.1 hypothetical protein ASC89_00260 [Devosia sp. Root413D1]
MALVGYARTSTAEQVAGLEAQIRDLRAAGVQENELFVEQVSSVGQRGKLSDAVRFLRRGDTFVVTKLDRLARSVVNLQEILDDLAEKEVALRILDFGGGVADTGSAQGKLMLNIFASIAQFEREIMLERQREGIAKAKADKKYKGRAPTAKRKSDDVLRMSKEGIGASEIAKRCGIGRASVYRILKEGAA